MYLQDFQVFCLNYEARFEEILGLSIKYFVINRKIGLDARDWEEWRMSTGDTKTPVTPSRGFKTVRKYPTLGTIPDRVLILSKGNSKENSVSDQGPVARSLVSANRWLRGIKMYRFPWYLTLVSTNHASSNPGQSVYAISRTILGCSFTEWLKMCLQFNVKSFTMLTDLSTT